VGQNGGCPGYGGGPTKMKDGSRHASRRRKSDIRGNRLTVCCYGATCLSAKSGNRRTGINAVAANKDIAECIVTGAVSRGALKTTKDTAAIQTYKSIRHRISRAIFHRS